jgi:hypothetical protein
MIVLNKGIGDAGLIGQQPLVVALEEEASTVAKNFRLQDQNIGNLGLDNVHVIPLIPCGER